MAPVIVPEGLVFVSNRDDELGVARHSKTLSEPFYKIYLAAKADSGFKKPVRLTGDINNRYSEGPASFSSDGKRMFFSRNIPSEKEGKDKGAHFEMFMANYSNGNCRITESFPFNKGEYSLGHPAIAYNMNFLIFASNMPGGFGGSDLYVSYNKDNKWSRPINLGIGINTNRNEVFPFVNAEGRLFFSSDGHEGEGGLDIYSANYRNFEWSNVHNLGAPFNSSYDDFSYTESEDKSTGFFASDREGNTKDDIYQFKVSKFTFNECDTLVEKNYCRTFYEENTINTDSLPLIYEWDFGNGNKKRGLEVNHCFEKPGKYIINLNIIDLITDQLYMNEASYELEIAPITGPYFSVPDTVTVGQVVTVDASKSTVENASILKYYWDFGDGVISNKQPAEHIYKTGGNYLLRLAVNCSDSTAPVVFSKCVAKPVYVADPSHFTGRKRPAYKPFFQIKDKKGNSYKIQLATSKEKLDVNAHYFKHIGKVEEYYDRGIFGYTVGSYERPELCYPELKKVKQKGFKEAIIIATKDNKVVSGTDSSFFIKLPPHFQFVRVLLMRGKVLDNTGRPVKATIELEELSSGILLDEIKTDSVTGRYEIELPVDKAYAYYIYKDGFFPFSNYMDLTKANDLLEMRSDIFLVGLEKMVRDSLPVRVNNIFFEEGKFNLKPESAHELKRLAGFFRKQERLSITIESHTDNLGDKYSKKIISKQRADEVKNFLVREGCSAAKIGVKAYGESKPIAMNPKMQFINNRIEIRLTGLSKK